MTHADDCDRFMVSLDRLEAEDFGGDELEWLEAHAARCPDCAAFLRLREHFPGGSDADLEAAVPRGMVEGMWDRVNGAIELGKATGTIARDRGRGAAARTEGRSSGDRRSPITALPPRRGWLLPAMAAAFALLALGGGLLLAELRGLQRTEGELRERLAAQSGRIEGMALAIAAGAPRVGDGRSADALGSPEWRARGAGGLLGGGDITVGELRAWLASLPADAPVLEAAELDRLGSRLPERKAARFRRAIATPALADGLQAEEALVLLDALGLGEGEHVDERRLEHITRGLLRGRGL